MTLSWGDIAASIPFAHPPFLHTAIMGTLVYNCIKKEMKLAWHDLLILTEPMLAANDCFPF